MELLLNFGPSPYQAGPTFLRNPDQVIVIPFEGEMERLEIGIERFELLGAYHDSSLTIDTNGAPRVFKRVTLSFLAYDNDWEDEIWLLWIEERNEWAAIRYSRWRESATSDDVSHSGPYELNELAEAKLCLAYRLPPIKALSGLVRKTSPEDFPSLWRGLHHKGGFREMMENSPAPDQISGKYSLSGHLFISYVREDSQIVDQLATLLEARGLHVWRDRAQLMPGVNWRVAIRKAIQEGMAFLACFSENYHRRSTNYMNEELQVAIQQLRCMADDKVWFIPVKLAPCELPEFEIRPGQSIAGKQWVDVYPDPQMASARIAASLRAFVGGPKSAS